MESGKTTLASALWRRLDGVLWPLALAVVVLLTRLPFMSPSLFYWDSVHFALALERFDVASHQPHPPGYILFVGLGYLANLLFRDPNRAYIAVGIGAAMIGAMAMYQLGKETFGRHEGLAAAVLLSFSPMLWFYSENGALYGVEPALVTLVLLLCQRAIKGQLAAVYLSAVVLGLAGGIRQTTLVFLLPVWLYAVWPRDKGKLMTGLVPARPWCHAAGALVLLAVIVTSWLIPLIMLAGGLQIYFRELSVLSKVDNLQTSVMYQGLAVLPQNILRVVAGLFNGLQAGAILYVLWILHLFPYRANPEGAVSAGTQTEPSRSIPSQRQGLGAWFVVLSVAPAACYFVFFHLGQLGYTAIFLPVAVLYLPPLTRSFVADLASRLARDKRLGAIHLDVHRATGLLLCFLVFLYVVGFLAAPFPVSLFGLSERNNRWSQTDQVVGRYDPKTTVLLTSIEDLDSFRHLLYYFPNYHVYMVDADTGQAAGWRFEGYQHRSNYGFSHVPPPDPEIAIPDGVATVIVFDDDIAALTSDWPETRRSSISEDRSVYVFSLAPETAKVKGVSFAHGLVQPLSGGS